MSSANLSGGDILACEICGKGPIDRRVGRNVTIVRCRGCGTCRVDHQLECLSCADGGEYWEKNGSPDFNRVLYVRRLRQARQFLNRFADQLNLRAMPASSIVDYGCGIGAFISEADAQGLIVAGCDLSLPDEAIVARQPWRTSRFTALQVPWEIDLTTAQARVVLLLDVLEHHPHPASLIAQFTSAEFLVVKVPNGRGPLGMLSSLVFPVHQGLYDRLALVGDIAPHLWAFTDHGLSAAMKGSGFSSIGRLRIAEVGMDASKRSRSVRRGPMSFLLGLSGVILSALSPFWSESIFRVYKRSSNTPEADG